MDGQAELTTMLSAYLNVAADPWKPDVVAGLALADLLEEQQHKHAGAIRDIITTPITLDRTSHMSGSFGSYERLVLATSRIWWAFYDKKNAAGTTGNVKSEVLARELDNVTVVVCDGKRKRYERSPRLDLFFTMDIIASGKRRLDTALLQAASLMACQTVATLLDPGTDCRRTMAVPTSRINCASRLPISHK